ncbi:MAG: hypothetical protein M1834_007555 [Cirrosporium novae-zelandiae]|nr:MAG: hypothetical protein M1834_007555 [Cirrosporium novae-zelandiae]
MPSTTSTTTPRSDSPDPIGHLPSTAPSSPPSETIIPDKMSNTEGISDAMLAEERKMAAKSEKEEEKRRQKYDKKSSKEDAGEVGSQFTRLEYLLSQSKIYANIMLAKLQKQEQDAEAKDASEKKRAAKREEKAEKIATEAQRKSTRSATTNANGSKNSNGKAPTQKKGRGRPKKSGNATISDYFKKEQLEAKVGKESVTEALEQQAEDDSVQASEVGAQNLQSARQPKLVTGGIMRKYQLEGLEWLSSLYENGLNGILADEMGLGKTVQTISLIAFLREKGIPGPYLIAAPLSTLSNWVDEFKRWTPDIPTVLYHGSKPDREEIRQTRMKEQRSWDFPVVCTSYEICMNDQKFLSKYDWKYIIIDEGHRLKNLNCRLIRELKLYRSANRLLITGTPLQNNLSELWSLLNFLMPEIFDTLETFESWFDFSAVLDKDGHKEIIEKERKNSLIASLHAVLKPFLLRRVKGDVESSLPPKREYILYAPLTVEQKELYHAILEGSSRTYLENKVLETIAGNGNNNSTSAQSPSLKRKLESGTTTPSKSAKTSRASTPMGSMKLGRNGRKKLSYKEVGDREYFKQLEETQSPSTHVEEEEENDSELEAASNIALAKKLISQKKLANPLLQLRLACNTPHAFYWPYSPVTNIPTHIPTILSASGKLLLLHRLLPMLLSPPDGGPPHKLLIFSQFTSVLDIIAETLPTEKYPHCRIDGSTSQVSRQAQIALFNTTSSKSTHHIFLLSTRAGGQGINLAAADTVILFDSDWNPQMDLQAIDRAHRIGQTRPVIVYRFATRGTVEETLLERAGGKRRLEKLVMMKGKFRSLLTPVSTIRTGTGPTKERDDELEELRTLLLRQDSEAFTPSNPNTQTAQAQAAVLSDADLEILTDRRPEAYERAKEGGHVGEKFKAVQMKKLGDAAADGGVGDGVLDAIVG